MFTVTVKLKMSERTGRTDNSKALPAGIKAAVVDDDEVACEHAQVVLKSLGVTADTFTSATEAEGAIKAAHNAGAPYRLLLTDYKMPDLNGLELTRAVRSFDGGETSVIMRTGYNWDIIDEEARADGVDGILAKPLFSDSLLRMIQYILERRGGAAEVAKDESITENILAGRRMLMAEDVDANAEILADLLDLEDMTSERAKNGEEAVEMFASKPEGYYDAILMDVRMPVKDGLAATEEIRALPRPDAATIPIIAMTANVFDEDVARSMKAGMNAHLSKPVEPDILYAKLAELISEKTE